MPGKRQEIPEAGIVYGAQHFPTGMWYIGSTTNTLLFRKHTHLAEVHNLRNAQRTKFYKALAESEETDWVWGVHEHFDCITRSDLYAVESEYQRAFNSVEAGFNVTYAAVPEEQRKIARAEYHRAWYEQNHQSCKDREKERRKTKATVVKASAQTSYKTRRANGAIQQYVNANRDKINAQARAAKARRMEDPEYRARHKAMQRASYVARRDSAARRGSDAPVPPPGP